MLQFVVAYLSKLVPDIFEHVKAGVAPGDLGEAITLRLRLGLVSFKVLADIRISLAKAVLTAFKCSTSCVYGLSNKPV